MKLLKLVAFLALQGCAFGNIQTVVHAQDAPIQPVQVKTFYAGGNSDNDITLDNPVRAGDALVVAVYQAEGYSWFTGPLCRLEPGWCNWYMLDSQRNRFQQVNEDYWELFYIPAAKGGQETISVYSSVPTNVSVVVMEFPFSLALVDVVPPRCDQIPVNGQQELCNDNWNSANSTVLVDNTATPSSHTITSSFDNELFIGNFEGGGFLKTTGLNGWSDPVWGGEMALNYLVVPRAGTPVANTISVYPPLAPGHNFLMGVAGFKIAQ